MPKISLITLSKNDNKEEPKRFSLFVDSLLRQTEQDWELIFLDCSEDGCHFKAPKHKNIRQVKYTIKKKEDFNPAYLRNTGVLLATGEMICHTNTDCVLAPNFLEVIVSKCKKNILVQCERRDTTEKEFKGFSTLALVDSIATSLKEKGRGCCGDCQAMLREQFIDIGGYFGLICNGMAYEGKYKEHAFREDTYLQYKVNKTNWGKYKFSEEEHGIKEIWVNNKTWIVHLWHPERRAIQDWRSS